MAYSNRWYYCFIFSIFFLVTSDVQAKWDYTATISGGILKVQGTSDDKDKAGKVYALNLNVNTSEYQSFLSTVLFNRLFRNSPYASDRANDFKTALLEEGYKIDYEKQQVYKEKVDNQSGCSYKNAQGKIVLFHLNEADSAKSRCPRPAVDQLINQLNQTQPAFSFSFKDYSPPDVLTRPINPNINVTVTKIHKASSSQSTDTFSIRSSIDPSQLVTDAQREILSPSKYAQFAISKNYASVLDSWLYYNLGEYSSSPTVLEVLRLLNGAPSKSQDQTVKPDENTGGFTIPDFCEWATPACDFFDWIKDETGLSESDQKVDIQTYNDDNVRDDQQFHFNTGNACPPPEKFSFTYYGDHTFEFSYEPLCRFLMYIRQFVIGASYIIGAYIIMGYSRGNSDA